MKIYCVRHGHADLGANDDNTRPLTEEGIAEVTRVADYLAHRGFHVSHVMHSEKRRAIQTANILAEKVASGIEPEESELLSPDTPVNLLVQEIQAWSDDTMLVGHMPFISFLVSQLVAGSAVFELVRFSPGTVVCLERYENHRWIINWILRPELIENRSE